MQQAGSTDKSPSLQRREQVSGIPKEKDRGTPRGRNMGPNDNKNPVRQKTDDLQTISSGEASQDEQANDKRSNDPVRLYMNKRQPDFSTEELEFFSKAIEHRHISQTHFADPGAGYCYRCPLCRKVINGEGVLQKIKIHFEMIHGDSNKEYHIVINGKEDAKVIIPSKSTGKLRDGAEPPTETRLASHGKELPQKGSYKPKRSGGRQNEGPSNPPELTSQKKHENEGTDSKAPECEEPKSIQQDIEFAPASTPGEPEFQEAKNPPGQPKPVANRKNWKKRAPRVLRPKKKQVKSPSAQKQDKDAEKSEGQLSLKGQSQETDENPKPDQPMSAVDTQSSHKAEETSTPTHQRRITDYFLTQDPKVHQTPDSQNKPSEEVTNAPSNQAEEEATSSQPSYLSVAMKALRREEKSGKSTPDK